MTGRALVHHLAQRSARLWDQNSRLRASSGSSPGPLATRHQGSHTSGVAVTALHDPLTVEDALKTEAQPPGRVPRLWPVGHPSPPAEACVGRSAHHSYAPLDRGHVCPTNSLLYPPL